MQHGYKSMRVAVKTNPLALLAITDKTLLKVANDYLPYDTGIEIECSFKGTVNDRDKAIAAFKAIPHIKEVKCDDYEQRFRIPKGIKGLICLYHLSRALKQHSTLNSASGIHYHVDCTDLATRNYWKASREHCYNPQSFILKALKSWGYKGTYNSWQVTPNKTAVRFHENYQTIEYRIGEMTFEYELLLKRILHCQNITRKVKAGIK